MIFGMAFGLLLGFILGAMAKNPERHFLNDFKKQLKEEVRALCPNSSIHFVLSVEKEDHNQEEESFDDPSESWRNN